MLRPTRESDAQAIYHGYSQDGEVTRFLMWRPHQDLVETREYLRRCEDGWNTGTELTWMLTRASDGSVLGAIALRPEGHKASIGYVLARSSWGQGLMSEAGRAVLQAAAHDRDLHRIWAVCDVENLASARVLEKIGMMREGILRRWVIHPNVSMTPRDALCYSWIPSVDEPSG
ncbi:MAG TPA: GNAT family N-acetyltransferase [Gemmatimonadaceae bacterium]|nr:GNAT family N-acetyltransferase [Gemmatimonadaceae bacterium]